MRGSKGVAIQSNCEKGNCGHIKHTNNCLREDVDPIYLTLTNEFAFCFLVLTVQVKDHFFLKYFYCIPSDHRTGDHRTVGVSQDTTFLPSLLSSFDVNRTSKV